MTLFHNSDTDLSERRRPPPIAVGLARALLYGGLLWLGYHFALRTDENHLAELAGMTAAFAYFIGWLSGRDAGTKS